MVLGFRSLSRWLAVSVLLPPNFLPDSLPSTRGLGAVPASHSLQQLREVCTASVGSWLSGPALEGDAARAAHLQAPRLGFLIC